MMQGYAGPVQQGDMVVRANEVSPGITALLSKQNRKGAQGIYELPSAKQPTPNYYNAALDNVQNEIRSAARMVNAMAPRGERLAYVNPEEGGILKLLGGAGEPQPVTGIPSYFRASQFSGPSSPGTSSSGGMRNVSRSSGNSGFQGSIGGGGGGNRGSSTPVSPKPSAPKPSSGDRNILRDLEDAMAKREKETGVKMAPRITTPTTTPTTPKEDKNILEKIVGSIFGEPDPEVKAIQSEVDKKIAEVKNDPNLTNFQKNQMIDRLKFAKSPEGRKTGYSMGELSKMIMSGVDQSRLGSIRLGGKDAKQLLDAGVITKENYDQALTNIEKYGRGVVFDPVKKILKTAPPTGSEFLGDVTRGAGSILENLPLIKIIKSLGGEEEVEKEPTESEEDFQDRVRKILLGSGGVGGVGMDPGTARAMYGQEKMLDYAGLSPSFFDPATAGTGFNLGTGQFGERATVGQPAISAQAEGAITRAMEPRDSGRDSTPVATTGAGTGEDDTDAEKDLPYFSYYRKFRQPMTYEDIIKRAYEGSEGPLLETLQEAMDRPRFGNPVLFGGK